MSYTTPKLFCPEHGEVMRGGITKVSGFTHAEMIFFCPACGHQLAAEGDSRPGARSEAEYLEHYDGDILRLPPIRLDDST